MAEGYLPEIDPDDLFERDHTAVLWVAKLLGYESPAHCNRKNKKICPT